MRYTIQVPFLVQNTGTGLPLSRLANVYIEASSADEASQIFVAGLRAVLGDAANEPVENNYEPALHG